jgi:hypothetical protein
MKFRPYLSLLILATLVVLGVAVAGLCLATRYSLPWWLFAYLLVQSALAAFTAIRALAK